VVVAQNMVGSIGLHDCTKGPSHDKSGLRTGKLKTNRATWFSGTQASSLSGNYSWEWMESSCLYHIRRDPFDMGRKHTIFRHGGLCDLVVDINPNTALRSKFALGDFIADPNTHHIVVRM
jgi:hypothetical protein